MKRIYIFTCKFIIFLKFIIIEPKLTNTVFNIILIYLKSIIIINRNFKKKFNNYKIKFIKICSSKLNFDYKDLFSNNIPSWLYIFDEYKILNKKMNVLEIGAYEGRSSFFLLKTLKNINLTCVDTFKPFHELQENDITKFKKIFFNFKKNISQYSDKVKIIKKKSSFFFNKNFEKFDLIHIDGSHEFKDVKNDAKEAFKILKNKGIIIFDDFLWQNNQALKESITYAILEFVNMNKNKIQILYVNYQLIIQKID